MAREDYQISGLTARGTEGQRFILGLAPISWRLASEKAEFTLIAKTKSLYVGEQVICQALFEFTLTHLLPFPWPFGPRPWRETSEPLQTPSALARRSHSFSLSVHWLVTDLTPPCPHHAILEGRNQAAFPAVIPVSSSGPGNTADMQLFKEQQVHTLF